VHHCGVYTFSSHRDTILLLNGFVFFWYTPFFCGSITWKWGNKSIRNLTQKTPRGAPGTRAAEYTHLCWNTYIRFTSANFYHIIIVIMCKPIDWRIKENRRWYIYYNGFVETKRDHGYWKSRSLIDAAGSGRAGIGSPGSTSAAGVFSRVLDLNV